MALKSKERLDDMIDLFNDETETAAEKRGIVETPKKRSAGRKKLDTPTPKAYMQLNIYGYEDYLYRMSQVQKKTMTSYVLELIQKDMEANAAAYEGLKLIPSLNKPPRKAKNTKAKKVESDKLAPDEIIIEF